MPFDVTFGFDSSDPHDQVVIEMINAYKNSRLRQGVGPSNNEVHFARHILATKTGRLFVTPLLSQMSTDARYTASEMGRMLGAGWTPSKVASKLRVLGRPEKTYGVRLFERVNENEYRLSQSMKEALMQAAARRATA